MIVLWKKTGGTRTRTLCADRMKTAYELYKLEFECVFVDEAVDDWYDTRMRC